MSISVPCGQPCSRCNVPHCCVIFLHQFQLQVPCRTCMQDLVRTLQPRAATSSVCCITARIPALVGELSVASMQEPSGQRVVIGPAYQFENPMRGPRKPMAHQWLDSDTKLQHTQLNTTYSLCWQRPAERVKRGSSIKSNGATRSESLTFSVRCRRSHAG
jgi:hypothetical protein